MFFELCVSCRVCHSLVIYQQPINNLKKAHKNAKADIADRYSTKGDNFRIKIGDRIYTARKDADVALKKVMADFDSAASTKVGEIAGFDIKMFSENTYTTKSGVVEVASKKITMQLVNHGAYKVETNSVIGLENTASTTPDKILAYSEHKLKQSREELASIAKTIGKPFELQADLDNANKRLEEVTKKFDEVNAQNQTKPAESNTEFDAGSENPLAELENNFSKITEKKDKNGNTLYYIDGKRSSMYAADELEKKQLQQVADFIFDDAAKALNISIEHMFSKTPQISICLKGVIDNKNYYKACGTFEDAVKCARYINEKYSGSLVEINAGNGYNNSYTKSWITINEAGEETVHGDEVKKIIEKLDAEQSADKEEISQSEIDVVISQEKLNELFKNVNVSEEFSKLQNTSSISVSNDISQSADEGKLKKAAIDAFTEKYPEGAEVNTSIGTVKISRRSIRESLSHSIYNAKADAVISLPEGMNNAAYIGKLSDFEGNEIVNHYFVYPIQYKNEKYYVFCRVRDKPFGERLFYIHDIFSDKEITEKSNTLSQTQPPTNGQVQLRGVALYRLILTNFFNEGKKNISADTKKSQTGNGSTNIGNRVDGRNLTDRHKLLQRFGKSMGTQVLFFDNPNADFHGAYDNGVVYLNVNSKRDLSVVFAHEVFHFLKANNAELFGDMAKAAGITEDQLANYLDETKRSDVKNSADVTEEMLADSMHDILKRVALKDKNLVERFFAWLQDTLQKFKDFLQNPKGKLTRGQYSKMADAFGKMAVKLKDADGNSVFRYNKRTHNLELANGESLDALLDTSESSDNRGVFNFGDNLSLAGAKFSFAGKKALTSDKQTLAQAKRMDKDGKSNDEIFNATGWFKGKDNKWRFEIPDNFDKIDFKKLQWNEDTQFALDEIYDNPALFAAYPKLRNVSVTAQNFLGSDGLTVGNDIYIDWALVDDDKQEAARTLVHEIQHVIQHYEKFSTGGNVRDVKKILRQNLDNIKSDVAKLPERQRYFDSLLKAEKALSDGKDKAAAKALKNLEESSKELPRNVKLKLNALAKNFDELDKARTEKDKFELYKRLGGEQESRAVEGRLFEREGTPTPHDDDALIVFNGKKYSMASVDANTGVANATEFSEQIGRKIQSNIDRGRAAIARILYNHEDRPAAMHRDEIGDIDFVWGREGTRARNFSDGYGISKILRKHGQTAVDMIPEVIAKGDITRRLRDRVIIEHEGYLSVVKLTWNRESKNWLVTNYDTTQETPNFAGEDWRPANTATEPSFGRVGASASESISRASQRRNSENSIILRNPRLSIGNSSGNNIDNAQNLTDNDESISRRVFEKYLNEGIMKMVRETVEKEIDKYVDFSKIIDPVERDKARDSLPSIRKMLIHYNLNEVKTNEKYKNRLAVKLEYARRCFENDGRIRNGNVRQMDGNTRQRGIFETRSSAVSNGDARGIGRKLRGSNVGLSRSGNVGGEKKGAREHFLKLYDEELQQKRSDNRGAIILRNPRLSIGNSVGNNDNSNEGFVQRVKNLLTQRPNQQNERIRKKINRLLSRLTGMKIAAGHMNNGLDIVVKDFEKVIRTNRAYDWANLMPAAGQKLAAILKLNPSQNMGNCIADWFMTGAVNNNSAEYKEFEKALRDNPEIRNICLEIQSAFAEWNNMTAMERVQSTIAFETPKPTIAQRIKKLWNQAPEQLTEELNPVFELVKQWEKITGTKLDNVVNPYSLFRNSRGIAGRAMIMIEQGAEAVPALKQIFPNIKWDNFKTVKTILDYIGALKDEQTYKEFAAYCEACHFKEMHEKNHEIDEQISKVENRIDELNTMRTESNDANRIKELEKRIDKNKDQLETLKKSRYETAIDEKTCDAVIRDNHEKYGAAQKDLVNFSNTTLAIMKDSGVISEQTYFHMLRKWKNYVPLHRVFDDNEDIKFGDSLKGIKGSYRDTVDPIQSIIRNTYDYIRRADKNAARLALARMARTGGVGLILEEVDDKHPNDNSTIMFLEDGVKKYLQTDPAVVHAVNNLRPPQLTWFTRFLRIGSSLLRAFATSHQRLIELIEQLRKNIGGYSIHINSGYRCPTHNANVGGVPNSQHVLGTAADLAVPRQLTFEQFKHYVTQLPFDWVELYPYSNFIYVDVRNGGVYGHNGDWME